MSNESRTLPPGLDGDLIEISKAGDTNWLPFVERRFYTNVFIVSNGKILLGYKKRGFGRSLWNGFGGKVEPGEEPATAALRELKEEAGIEAPLEHCGTLLFLTDALQWACQIEIYRANSYTGEIIETDEMRPQWFTVRPSAKKDDTAIRTLTTLSDPFSSSHDFSPGSIALSPLAPPIPYDEMWAGDRHWIPLLLEGHHFVGREDFETVEGAEKLRRWWFGLSREQLTKTSKDAS